MFLSGLKYLRRLERQVKFAKNRCCKIKPVAVNVDSLYEDRLYCNVEDCSIFNVETTLKYQHLFNVESTLKQRHDEISTKLQR